MSDSLDYPLVIFNSSLPRSGSTLLQNILAQNPRFHCSPTSGLIGLLEASRIPYTDAPVFKAQDPGLMQSGFRSYCRHALVGFYRGITERPICVDKSRMWLNVYEWLASFYPNPKVLVCVRDLRAILSSMEKLWRKNRPMEPQRYTDPTSALRMMTVPNRVTYWLNSNPVGFGLLSLLDAHQRGALKNMHVVRYEDLTSNPRATMEGVYRYLGETAYEHDFDNVTQTTQEDDAFHGMYGDHQIRRKVEPVPADYWETLGRDLSGGVVQNNPVYYSLFYPGTR